MIMILLSPDQVRVMLKLSQPNQGRRAMQNTKRWRMLCGAKTKMAAANVLSRLCFAPCILQ